MSRPLPARPRTWNAWVREVSEAYTSAAQAWYLEAEAASCGYATELREYAETHPRPRYRDFLESMAGGQCYA